MSLSDREKLTRADVALVSEGGRGWRVIKNRWGGEGYLVSAPDQVQVPRNIGRRAKIVCLTRDPYDRQWEQPEPADCVLHLLAIAADEDWKWLDHEHAKILAACTMGTELVERLSSIYFEHNRERLLRCALDPKMQLIKVIVTIRHACPPLRDLKIGAIKDLARKRFLANDIREKAKRKRESLLT